MQNQVSHSVTERPNANWFENAVLVYGPRKAGTTLLHNLLDGNDDLFVYPDELKLKRLARKDVATGTEPERYRERSRIFQSKLPRFDQARYAAACQAASIVPMIEPEVLLDGDHSIERCEEVTEATLRATYAAVAAYNVFPEFLILKTSMVVSGKGNARQAGPDEVAERTLRVLKRTVPAAQPGIVFLSGGQSDESATAHLSAMAATKGLPWPLTFSYSRALQNPALNTWRGQAGNVAAAQKAFHHRAHMNSLACQGKWRPELERQAA